MNIFLPSLRAIHPTKMMNNGQKPVSYDVVYMRFGSYWFATGYGKDAASWQYDKLLPKFVEAIIWC